MVQAVFSVKKKGCFSCLKIKKDKILNLCTYVLTSKMIRGVTWKMIPQKLCSQFEETPLKRKKEKKIESRNPKKVKFLYKYSKM